MRAVRKVDPTLVGHRLGRRSNDPYDSPGPLDRNPAERFLGADGFPVRCQPFVFGSAPAALPRYPQLLLI